MIHPAKRQQIRGKFRNRILQRIRRYSRKVAKISSSWSLTLRSLGTDRENLNAKQLQYLKFLLDFPRKYHNRECRLRCSLAFFDYREYIGGIGLLRSANISRCARYKANSPDSMRFSVTWNPSDRDSVLFFPGSCW